MRISDWSSDVCSSDLHCEVRAMDDDGDGMRLATSQGDRLGRDVLIATGAWSPLLAKTTGLSKLPIQPGKGYSITYDRPALAPKRPQIGRASCRERGCQDV